MGRNNTIALSDSYKTSLLSWILRMRLVPMFYVHSIFSWTARAVVDPGYLHCLAGMELDWKKNSPSTEIMRMNSGELYNYLPTQYLMSIQWTLLTVHVAIQSNGLTLLAKQPLSCSSHVLHTFCNRAPILLVDSSTLWLPWTSAESESKRNKPWGSEL